MKLNQSKHYSAKTLLSAVGFALAISSVVNAATKPNILVILSDDQGHADVGFNGSEQVLTPHLDQLAREGLRCTNGYVTHPYCSPSRAGRRDQIYRAGV